MLGAPFGMMAIGVSREVRGAVDRRLVTALDRHVGHQLTCARETTGDVAGIVVESLSLRCDDCGEVVLEGVKRRVPGRGRRKAG
jgi:hypothetical protein